MACSRNIKVANVKPKVFEPCIMYSDYEGPGGKELLATFLEMTLDSTNMTDEERARSEKAHSDLTTDNHRDEGIVRIEDISSDEGDDSCPEEE